MPITGRRAYHRVRYPHCDTFKVDHRITHECVEQSGAHTTHHCWCERRWTES